MMAFTLAHELVHRAKAGSPIKFKAFADFLIQEYGKQGADIEAMIGEQMAAAKEAGIKLTPEQAYEEVICDACQKMLMDTDAGMKLAEFGAQSEQNRNFLAEFKKWLTESLEKLRDLFRNVEPDSLPAKGFQKFDTNVKRILANMFVDMSVDAGEKLSTIKEAGMLEKITTNEGGVKYCFGITQADIDTYIDAAYENNNSEDVVKYAEASDRLIDAVSSEIDISGYSHALRDNDIRHIRNSHGENTNEKYPVTKSDLARIPYIVENYDKVFVKTNSRGKPGIVYVKVGENNVVYYVEAVTTEYHNEKLLVNKQMVKTGIDEIPNLYGLIAAINKKESSSQYLADLQEIRKAYAQGVKENYSDNSIRNASEIVKNETKQDSKKLFKLPVESKTPTYQELVNKKPIEIISIGHNEAGLSYAEIKKQVLKNANDKKVFDKPHLNKDTGVSIFLTPASYSHAFSNPTADFGADTLLAMDHITEIIHEAVLTHIAPPKNPRKAESRVFTFFAAVEGKNGIEPVKLTVKEYVGRKPSEIPKNIRRHFEENGEQETHNRLYDAEVLEVIAIEGTKKESGASASVANRKRLGAKGTPNSTIKIAELLDLVNGDAKKYVPQDATGERYKLPVESKTGREGYLKPSYEEWEVQAALYDAMNHADRGDDNLIKVGSMPHLITELLGIYGDFYIYRNHAYENMVSKEQAIKDGRPITRNGKEIHFHGLGIEKVNDAIMALATPIMTIEDGTEYGNPEIVMILPVEGNNGAPLYAALSFYKGIPINGQLTKKPHVVLTISNKDIVSNDGHEGYLELINRAIDEKRVISYDKEKMSTYLSVIANHTRVGNITRDALTNNIASARKKVNRFREKNNINYKLPVAEDTSPRTLLTNALESVAQNDIEKQKITEYKAKVEAIEAEEQKLHKLNTEIKELSFAKGPRDTARIKALRDEATKIANRIGITYFKC